jgi:hypothetical protein
MSNETIRQIWYAAFTKAQHEHSSYNLAMCKADAAVAKAKEAVAK